MTDMSLSDLKGVGDATLVKLEEAGISTIMALATSSPAEVSSVAGMSESVARKLIKSARESLSLGFEKAKEHSKRRQSVQKISTGSSAFDGMINGGFESGTITQVYGQFSSGKTQLSHLLCVRALLDNPEAKAIYIDTESTFREDRIRDFAVANGIDPEDALERIYVARAYNADHQELLAEEAEKILQKDDTYRLLVVDSLTSHYRAEFIGRGTLANRQQKLNKHMHQLLRMADLYNIVVLVTNQVMAKPDSFYGDPTAAIGGHIAAHNSTFIIYMRPGKAGSRYAKLVDSPNLPNNECNFMVTKEGFTDV